MQPHIGDVVLVRSNPAKNNGSDVAPAIVTKVAEQREDGSWSINTRVMLDGSDATPAKAVALYYDQQAADAAVPTLTNTHVAWWPPRL